MKVLIGDNEFKGLTTSATDDMLNLNIIEENNDTFTELMNLLPAISNEVIKIYGEDGTEQSDVIVAAYQAYYFFSLSRSFSGDSKVILTCFKTSPIEVTEADKINQRIKAQNETIAQQNATIQQQAETIASQANKLVEQEKTNTLLTAQVQSVSDRADFVDDCIAEMASIVYA